MVFASLWRWYVTHPLKKKKMLGSSLKVLIISERLLLVRMILGFRVLVILIKCVLKISDGLLSSKVMQSFSEIIVFLC